MVGFIFGGNTGETAESLARKRKYAEALLAPGETPRNVTEGWGAIAKALAGRLAMAGVEKKEGERRQRASDAVARALGGLGPFPSAPDAGSADSRGSAVMAALNGETAKPKPVNPNLPSRMDFANAADAQQPGEIESYIRQAAIQRGIDPDIAVRVAQSEGGLTDPVRQSDVIKDGVREPSFGPFQLYMNGGLGNAFQAETGLHPSDPNAWRQGVDFALDSAKKDGWGAWYGAKNVGITGMDGIGGPAAALDKMAAGTPQGPGRQGEIRQGSDGRAYQYAETTGMANATGPQGWIPVNAQAPVQVAQAGGDFSQFSPAAGGTGGTVQPGQLDLGLLFEAARNPDLSAEERGLINMLVGQEMEKRDPLRRLQMQKLEKELGTPQKQWQKLDDETLFDPASGEVKKVGSAPANGGGFRFKGTSVEAQSLNGLMDSGQLTPKQAQQLGAGKTVTGPNGEILFMTPQGVFGQAAPGGPAMPLTPSPPPAPVPAPAVTPSPAAPAPTAAPADPARPGILPITEPKPVKPTDAQRNRSANVQAAAKTINSELDRYADLVGKTGIEAIPGKEKDNLNAVRQGIMLQLKELFNLGVLNGPDLSLMERMIYDPVVDLTKEGGFSNLPDQIWTAATGDPGERAKNSVAELKRMLESILSGAILPDGHAPSATPAAPASADGWKDMGNGVRLRVKGTQ